MVATVTVNVRHKLGLLGKAAVAAAWMLTRLRIRPPVRLLVWCVNRSSYVRIDGGPWQRAALGLTIEDVR
jgi:hypothetical protein